MENNKKDSGRIVYYDDNIRYIQLFQIHSLMGAIASSRNLLALMDADLAKEANPKYRKVDHERYDERIRILKDIRDDAERASEHIMLDMALRCGEVLANTLNDNLIDCKNTGLDIVRYIEDLYRYAYCALKRIVIDADNFLKKL